MKSEKTDPTLRSLDLPRLVVELPDGKEIQHPLSGEEITIGRDPKNRIAIADNFISKFHAKLIISKTSLVLVDLASANKTYVNDRPISEAPVRYGDKIRFAAVKCRLEAPESHGKKAPPVLTPTPPKPPVEAPQRAETPKAPPPPRPVPPKPSPRAAAKPPPANTPGSAPPPIEADPMKRLLRVGGLLIVVSLALAAMLRVLLVPSEAPPPHESDAEARGGTETEAPPANTPRPTVTTPVTTDAHARRSHSHRSRVGRERGVLLRRRSRPSGHRATARGARELRESARARPRPLAGAHPAQSPRRRGREESGAPLR